MPFNFKETVGGLNHLRLGLARRLLRQPGDRFLKHLGRPGGQPLCVPSNPDGSPLVCPICGFAVARLELAGGWTLETCSATGLRPVLRACNLGDWVGRLPAGQEAAGPSETPAADLPRPGAATYTS